MKVLFLDVDGVLNCMLTEPPAYEYGCTDILPLTYSMLDPRLISELADIIHKTGASVVLSSTWRRFDDHKKALDRTLALWGVRIHDVTPCIDTMRTYLRGEEIAEWLRAHDGQVERYCIVDDDNDMLPEQQPHFVHCYEGMGFQGWHALQVQRILGVKEETKA